MVAIREGRHLLTGGRNVIHEDDVGLRGGKGMEGHTGGLHSGLPEREAGRARIRTTAPRD